jgi:SAM-dependent methyltransferase
MSLSCICPKGHQYTQSDVYRDETGKIVSVGCTVCAGWESEKRVPIKLDIGGGLYPKPGYTNLDLYATGPGIVTAPADSLPYADGTVDAIWSSHFLEHNLKARIVPTLAEWYRVLRPGGLLQLQVPDLVACCERWLNDRGNGWLMDCIFGNQDGGMGGGQIHYTGFTELLLEQYLREAGFTGKIEIDSILSHDQKTIRCEVIK